MSRTRTALSCHGKVAARCGLVCLGGLLAGCDPSVFDVQRGVAHRDAAVALADDAGSRRSDSGSRDNAQRQDPSAGARSRDPAVDGGRSAAAGVAAAASARAGSGGGTSIDAGAQDPTGGTGGNVHAAAAGGDGSAGAAGGGVGGKGGMGALTGLDMLRSPRCPSVPTGAGESFCYDFEQGRKGSASGDLFWLWNTPDEPTETELSTPEQPAGSGNHVLLVSPRLTATYPSATIGHDTRRFMRALVEFDFWANATLLNVENEVVFFRFLPDERDFDHGTNLILRRGQAYLRLEDGGPKDFPLSRLPSESAKTRVSIVLDRKNSCSVQVYFDGALVVTSDAVTCAPDGQVGFVEYGLVMIEKPVGPISAMYDDIALGME